LHRALGAARRAGWHFQLGPRSGLRLSRGGHFTCEAALSRYADASAPSSSPSECYHSHRGPAGRPRRPCSHRIGDDVLWPGGRRIERTSSNFYGTASFAFEKIDMGPERSSRARAPLSYSGHARNARENAERARNYKRGKPAQRDESQLLELPNAPRGSDASAPRVTVSGCFEVPINSNNRCDQRSKQLGRDENSARRSKLVLMCNETSWT
jgi:hypothetical protein